MADIFKNLDPFIADETLKALCFTLPDKDTEKHVPSLIHPQNASLYTSSATNKNSHRDRRPRIVQVLYAQLFNNDSPPYLIISDGTNCVHLFLPSTFFYNSDESIPPHDLQQHHEKIVFGSARNKAFISRGALIKIRNYSIVPISQYCKDYFSNLQPLPHSHATYSIHPTVCWAIVGCRVLTNEERETNASLPSVSSYLPLIQILGCDGSDIFGNPLDVHECIDFKRVIKQHTYETMIQRLLACHWNYSSSLAPGSYLEWPHLQQRKRSQIDAGKSSIGVHAQNQPSVATDMDTFHHNRITIPSTFSVNTSEQETLLSMYRSFELSEAAKICPITYHNKLGSHDIRFSVVDPYLPNSSSLKPCNLIVNSDNETALPLLDVPDNATISDKLSKENVDEETNTTEQNSCPFPSISEMLHDDDESFESPSPQKMMPCTQSSYMEDSDMGSSQQVRTLEDTHDTLITTNRPHQENITKGNIDSRAAKGIKSGYTELQKRAKLRKFQYYFIQKNDNLT